MTPRIYYETDNVQLWLGDAREVLPTLTTVDLVVTDPPYGVKWVSNFRTESFGDMVGDADTEAGYAAIQLALSILKHGRHLYVFGPFDYSGLPVVNCELIWDKAGMIGMGNLTLPYAPAHERIAFGVYVPSAKNRQDGKGRLSARMRRGSVLRYPRPNSRAVRHPSEKPVPLLRELIESSSCFGETVLDPFAGSGSTLVAAVLEGRKAIGIEIEERWCELAANRLRQIESIAQIAA